jgi:copper chaperone CopZ
MTDTTLHIDGMHCDGCASSVARALKAVPGVDAADVSLATGTATIRHDATRAPLGSLRTAIEDAGFDVRS